MSAVAVARGALVQVLVAERRHAARWLQRAVGEADRRIKVDQDLKRIEHST